MPGQKLRLLPKSNCLFSEWLLITEAAIGGSFVILFLGRLCNSISEACKERVYSPVTAV